jgi:hypothetical protein
MALVEALLDATRALAVENEKRARPIAARGVRLKAAAGKNIVANLPERPALRKPGPSRRHCEALRHCSRLLPGPARDMQPA